jgi:hypothetical protein
VTLTYQVLKTIGNTYAAYSVSEGKLLQVFRSHAAAVKYCQDHADTEQRYSHIPIHTEIIIGALSLFA